MKFNRTKLSPQYRYFPDSGQVRNNPFLKFLQLMPTETAVELEVNDSKNTNDTFSNETD